MADVSAVDAGRESRSDGAVRDRAGAGTFSWLGLILTVVGTNVALGTFLWLVTDARFNSMESRFESRFTSIESRLSNIESVLMSGAGAPVATDEGER